MVAKTLSKPRIILVPWLFLRGDITRPLVLTLDYRVLRQRIRADCAIAARSYDAGVPHEDDREHTRTCSTTGKEIVFRRLAVLMPALEVCRHPGPKTGVLRHFVAFVTHCVTCEHFFSRSEGRLRCAKARTRKIAYVCPAHLRTCLKSSSRRDVNYFLDATLRNKTTKETNKKFCGALSLNWDH